MLLGTVCFLAFCLVAADWRPRQASVGRVVVWWGGGVARPHCVVGWFGWLRPESCDAGRKQGNSDKCDGMMVVMVTIMSRVIVWPCANLLKSIKP